MPTALREAFNSHKIPLSDELTVSVKPWKDSRWLISDTKYEQTYSIRAVEDTVGAISESRLNVYESKIEHHILEVEMLSGMYKGRRLVLRNIVNHNMPLLSIPAEPGDVILCRVAGNPEQVGLVNIVQDYGRDRFLIWIIGGMLLLIILVGRMEGIRTACAMLISAGVIYFFMLPLISGGANAVFIVTLTSGVVAFVSLVFVIGPSRKTFSAVLGTMGGILVAGLIVLFAQQHLHFSGLENAISADIVEATRTPPFDFVQILLAGMLMGVLGVAVDGAIEVASSMEEIRKANPNMPTWRLIASGLNVGTDILGTMVNTLVFCLSRRGIAAGGYDCSTESGLLQITTAPVVEHRCCIGRDCPAARWHPGTRPCDPNYGSDLCVLESETERVKIHYCGHHAITVPKLANALFSPLVRIREPWTTIRASRLVIL